MKIKIQHLFLVFGLTLACYLLSLPFVDVPNSIRSILDTVYFCLHLGWLLLLFRTSSIRKSKYLPVAYILFALLCIASISKLQHWPIAGTLFILSIGLFMLTYLLWFFIKRKYQLSDFLKLVWLEHSWFLALCILQHWPINFLRDLNEILFIALLACFLLEQKSKGFIDLR